MVAKTLRDHGIARRKATAETTKRSRPVTTAPSKVPLPAQHNRTMDLPRSFTIRGSSEMLCTWARDYRVTGTGVDISTVFIAAARARATELGVADQVGFVHGD